MESADPYVVKRFPIWRRLLRAAGPGLLTLVFLGAGVPSNLERGKYGSVVVVLVIAAGFAYWAYKLWCQREAKELATIKVPATPASWSWAYIMFFLGATFPVLAIWILNSPENYLVAGLTALFFLLIGGLMLRPDEVLTMAAREEQGRLSSVFIPPTNSSSPVDAASNVLENSLHTVWQAIVGIAVVIVILAVLIVPFFFAPWWAIIIIWLLILIAFK